MHTPKESVVANALEQREVREMDRLKRLTLEERALADAMEGRKVTYLDMGETGTTRKRVFPDILEKRQVDKATERRDSHLLNALTAIFRKDGNAESSTVVIRAHQAKALLPIFSSSGKFARLTD